MEQALTTTQANSIEVVCKQNPVSGNYDVSLGNGAKLELVRDVDFGVIPGTKSPSLFKSGAERIIFSYGLETKFVVESAIEKFDGDMPYFFYRVRCEVYRNGTHITDGMGSANTNERQCGAGNKFDMANSRLKMAKKRAMVDACLLLGQLSNAFTQDIEDEKFMKNATEIPKDDDVIDMKRVKLLFATGKSNGYTQEELKAIVKEFGFDSTKEVTQKAYKEIMTKITEEKKC